MWLLIVLAVLLVLGPTRRVLVANWKTCVPMIAGAAAGFMLGQFLFGSVPGFGWVPWAWAGILALLAAKEGKDWLDGIF